MCPSATPTMLLPGPMSDISSWLTVCWRSPGSVGSTVSAKRVFSVLAGGSRRCASWAASTSPVRASATSQDSAETSGSPGAARCGRTWVPSRYRYDDCGTAARGGTGGTGSVPAAAATGVNDMTAAAQNAQVVTAARDGKSLII